MRIGTVAAATLARRAAIVVGRQLGAIAVFALPGVALFWHAWDGHLASTLTCTCGDSGQEVWFLAWPAYALAHGLNPFFSHALYPPGGVNLLVNTSAPLVGLVLAPLTWTAGPIAATNVALTLTPALSAWGAWVACRHFTSWRPASWVAGFLFGYSPFVVDNLTTGHVSISLLVVPPLALVVGHDLLVTRRHRPAWSGAALGLLAAVQFLISPEVLTISVVVGAVLLLVALALRWRRLRPDVTRLLRATPAIVVVGGLLLAYPGWLLLAGPRHVVGPPWLGVGVLGIHPFDLWDPGTYSAPANALVRLSGYLGQNGPPSGYLGVAVLLGSLAAIVLARRRLATWLLVAGIGVSYVLSLGLLFFTSATGYVAGLWLPWQALGTLPILNRVIPDRFAATTGLLVAVLVAVGLDAAWRLSGRYLAAPAPGGLPPEASLRPDQWLDRSVLASWSAPTLRRLVGVALVLLAVAVMIPIWWTYQVPLAVTAVAEPAWFATAGRGVPAGSVVLAYPFPFPAAGTAEAMVWQAEDGMRFSLAGGYVKAPGAEGKPLSQEPHTAASWLLAELSSPAPGPLPSGTPAQLATLRGALRRWGVSYVVVTALGRDPRAATALLTKVIGRPPAVAHGARVWVLRR